MEEATFTLYRISRCGYYARGSDEHQFGTLQSTLADLVQWAGTRRLGQTRIDKPRNDDDKVGTYIADARSEQGRTLLTLWNEVPSIDGQVASVHANSGVGEPHVVMNDIEAGTIPGYATYFYFVPDMNVVAGVRFGHPAYGHGAMRDYLKSFLKLCGRHTAYVPDDDTGELRIAGYVRAAGEVPRSLKPSFTSDIFYKAGQQDHLLREASRIIKVVRKTELHIQVAAERALWQRMLQTANLIPARQPAAPVRINYAVDAQVDAQEVRGVIDSWATQVHNTEWDDVGFVLAGEASKTYWLSHSIARSDLQLDVRRDSAEIVNAQSLIRELRRNEALIRQAAD